MKDFLKEVYKTWNELSDSEKNCAIENYMWIREIEEQEECSLTRAKDEAPYCKGYWVNVKYGCVTCNI